MSRLERMQRGKSQTGTHTGLLVGRFLVYERRLGMWHQQVSALTDRILGGFRARECPVRHSFGK